MSVPAKDFHKVLDAPSMKIMSVIVDRYGYRMADDIAAELVKEGPGPQVNWPRF